TGATTANSTAAAARRFLRNNRQDRSSLSPAGDKLASDPPAFQKRDSSDLTATVQLVQVMLVQVIGEFPSKRSSRSSQWRSVCHRAGAASSACVRRRSPRAARGFELPG